MPFQHLAGVTTPGAADPVVDWFATFEAWIDTVVGWTVVAGAGTTDLVLSSVGEAAGYTKLFVHIRRDGGMPNRVRGDVRDDAAGTNQTTCLGYVDSGGVQFAYWMSADLDAIAIVFKVAESYRLIYLGCLMPFALAPVDETYYMVATNGLLSSAILRNHNGLWDQNITNYHDTGSDDEVPCPLDDTFPIFPLIANDGNEIAGEFRLIGGRMALNVALTQEHTMASGYAGATSEWIILSHTTDKFPLMTAAGLPAGTPDGASWAFQAGVTADATNFITVVLPAFLVAMGWTDLGSAGVDTVSRLFYSQGESGTEDIYCIVSWLLGGNSFFRVYVQDDAAGTHRTPAVDYAQMNGAWFPANYYISGDLDCFVFACENSFARWDACWVGMVVPFNPNLPNTTYKVCTRGRVTSYVLRGHDDVWSKQCVWNWGGLIVSLSQPSLFDGTTYFLWPTYLDYGVVGALFHGVGLLKYLFLSSGGGITNADTITVGPEVYTDYIEQANTNILIRTT